jgi:predicted transcriptional regulator
MDDEQTIDVVELATELTIAWLGNPNSRAGADDVPAFLKSMFDALSALGGPAIDATPAEPAQEFVGAVTARKSLSSPAHIISMIDGKPYKTLRRHLSGHGLTPDEYRARYGLKGDYPMVAQAYSETRRAMAKKIGLGRKPGAKLSAKAMEPAPAPAKPTRAKAVAPAPAKPARTKPPSTKAAAPARARGKKQA